MLQYFVLKNRVWKAYTFAAVVAISCCASGISRRAFAAELAEQSHSLRVVPFDAAFYSASLRLKEQLDIFLESKAYQRFMEIGIVQIGKAQLMMLWQQAAMPQVAEFREYVESAEGQDAVELLKDMFSEEIFAYGSSDVADALAMFTAANSMSRQARIEAIAGGEDAEEIVRERTMEVLAEHIENFKIPTLVIGWRIKDGERAERQLDAVHSLVRNLLDEHRPELSPYLQRDQIGGREFLTLRLDGSMIPWDEIRQEEDEQEEVERWRELVSDKTLAVALGITDEFVLLSVGQSTDHLETFGQGNSLSAQPAVARLNKHADERVASISYVSKDLAQKLSSPEQTVEDLAGFADEVLVAAEVSDEQREQLVADIRGLGSEFKKYMPEPGDVAGISFLTSRGYEGFTYRAGAQPMWDSSQPLTLVKHVGGSPLLFAVGRSKESPEDYEQAVEWVKRIGVQVEKIAESKVPREEWSKYQQYRERGLELLERLDRANREHFIPALADGQSALVVDTSAVSTQWVRQMPESPKPLPMLELAVVTSVSDADHLRQGILEVVHVAEDALALAREINPDEVPEFEVPYPEKRELAGGGTIYSFSLPEEWGLDTKVAPNAGLTDTTAVASWSPETTERLLQETDLDMDTSLDLDRPAAVMAHFQFAKLINAIGPWLDYGFAVATGQIKVDEEESEDEEAEDEANNEQAALAMQLGFVIPQVQQFLQVSTVLRSFSSVTYEEDGLWITHSEVHLKDLE